MSIGTILRTIWGYVSHGLVGFTVGSVSAYIGGQYGGIDYRCRLNETKKYPYRPNRYGDTEGTYLVFYAFLLGVGSAIALPICTKVLFASVDSDGSSIDNIDLPWSTFLMTCAGVSIITSSICAYMCFYTI